MSLIATARRFVSRHGETATLAREEEATTITLKARRVSGTLEELAGGTGGQQSFRVRIGSAELLASAWTVKAPARGDHLNIGGRVRSVLDARPVKDGAAVGLYDLEVAG